MAIPMNVAQNGQAATGQTDRQTDDKNKAGPRTNERTNKLRKKNKQYDQQDGHDKKGQPRGPEMVDKTNTQRGSPSSFGSLLFFFDFQSIQTIALD